MKDNKMNTLKRKIIIGLFITIFVTSNVLAEEIKFLNVGMLQSYFSSYGTEIELARTGETSDQQDGLEYPAQYRNQDMQAAKGLWIGAKNYEDPLRDGSTYDHKVVHVGPRAVAENTQIMPQEFRLDGKFNHPVVTVDGTPASQLNYSESEVNVKDDLKAHRVLHNKVNTSMGITFTREVYAFGNRDFFIYDFTLENTGIYNTEGDQHNQTIEDVILFLQWRLAVSKMVGSYGLQWAPQSATWGHNTVNELIHPKFGDKYTGIYAWHGLHSKYSGNNHGAPNLGSGTRSADGFLGATQFPGVVSLHADKSAEDSSNDPSQFRFSSYFNSDASITQPPHEQFSPPNMAAEYEVMSDEIEADEATHAQELGYPHNPSWKEAPFGNVDNADGYKDAGGAGVSQGIGYGPYTLEPGESVNIVFAEAVGSISWEKRMNIGEKWFNEEKPYVLPNGEETDDRNKYKDAWVFTGRDSLFQAFEEAKKTYEKLKNDEQIVTPPPPPNNFAVNSGGDRITLEWSDNAESYSNFGGYKIYRQEGTSDTTFNLIHKCGGNTDNPIINKFEDKTAERGYDYYYYVTAFDDGSVDPEGEVLESSLFWTKTTKGASLKRPPGEELKDIRVVPNPYNISSKEYQFGQYAKDRIMFYNIPGECTIKIYTERGDLVKTLKHDDGSGDEAWDSVTSSRQAVSSGVYIAHISTPDGRETVKKIMIVR